MSSLEKFPFKKDSFNDIRKFRFGKNWPVNYIIKNDKELYVGETTNVFYRCKQHYVNPERRKLNEIIVISDDDYNKSASLDIESWLIQYILADNRFILQNGNAGLKESDYFDRDRYKSKFEKIIWNKLKEMKIVSNDLLTLKNSNLFKYSPYKCLTPDQLLIVKTIVKKIINNQPVKYIINGKPGTGKTILAVYLFKYLKEKAETKDLDIGLVIPMTSLRGTLKKIFKNIKGLNAKMVIGPAEVVNQKYDLLIVDEAHRLRRRKNITNYRSHDDINKKLSLDNNGSELDWIIKRSTNQILFYDAGQSVRPSDIRKEAFDGLVDFKKEALHSQIRVEGGDDYIKFIDSIFDLNTETKKPYIDYDFRLFDDLGEMLKEIQKKDSEHGLCRTVAGYAWPWNSKKNKESADIVVDGLRLMWNSELNDWVNSKKSLNEVGCIHTVQGYDLNYVGVIIGPEIKFDKENNKFVIDKDKYYDSNGKKGIDNEKELEGYIINIYKTLMTRGIKGCFVYCVDEGLRESINNRLKN